MYCSLCSTSAEQYNAVVHVTDSCSIALVYFCQTQIFIICILVFTQPKDNVRHLRHTHLNQEEPYIKFTLCNVLLKVMLSGFDCHECTRGVQYFCPFAVKATSTTLIFVEYNTFHQINLLDGVHKL